MLVVGEFGVLNGGEKSFLAIAPTLIERGWELIAAIPYNEEPNETVTDLIADGARVSFMPVKTEFAQALESRGMRVVDWNVREGGKRKDLSQIRDELRRLIEKVKPAIVHFNSLSTSRIGGPVTAELKIPSLGYLRDIMKVSKTALGNINQVDHIIAVSHATKSFHVSRGLTANRSSVVYNGVDSKAFSPQNKLSFNSPPTHSVQTLSAPNGIRAELSIASSAPVLLFVGQIGIRKGVDTLVTAFLSLAETHKDAQLLIIGRRHAQKDEAIEYEAKIQDQIASSPNGTRVHLLGRRDDVADIMRESDILVHPARQEPLGRVLLEASASGLAIATTNVGGSPEIICGPSRSQSQLEHLAATATEPATKRRIPSTLDKLLVPPDDPLALEKLLCELLTDPEELKRIGEQLRTRAISLFSVHNCASQINNRYHLLLSEAASE